MTHFQPTRRLFQSLLAAALGLSALTPALAQKTVEMRYGHMNPPTSAAGMQAQWLADAIAKNSNGQVKVTVYPSSQLGKLQELAEAVSTGTIALSHNTAAGIGSLHEPFAALDTPYLYRNIDHLMKVVDVNSPVMKKLNEGLVSAAGVRVLYAYYFGTRQLTANKAVFQPSDLAGQKIRAIPFPIYMTAVQGLGAVPVPVDWSEVPTALATGVSLDEMDADAFRAVARSALDEFFNRKVTPGDWEAFAGSLDYENTAKDLLALVKTKKTELLFLALFLRLLKPGGRAAVIVPDGVLFGSSNAHKTLRQLLVEERDGQKVACGIVASSGRVIRARARRK